MESRRGMIGLTALFSLFLIMGNFCTPLSGFAAEGGVYLKNNIHCQERTDRSGKLICKASYANYTNPGAGHIIVPVNTPVKTEPWSSFIKNGLIITDQTNGKKIYFEYKDRNMGGMSAEAYVNMITSPEKVSMKGLSKVDIKGIKVGKAYIGMTKKGVRMAMGYPAIHRTPSLDSNTWVYWTNRFKTMAIEFDPEGKVILIR